MRSLLGAAIVAALLSSMGAAAATPAAELAVVNRWAGPDGGWDFSAFDPVHRRLYVARTNGVTAADVDTGQVTSLLSANRTHAAIPINDGAEVLVTEGASGRALVADARTGAVRAAIPVGKKPDAALVEPATGLALVLDNAGGGMTLIDPRTAKTVGVIATPGGLESAAADGTGRVFANVEDLGEITVFDVKARKVVAHWKLDGCDSPSGLAYAPRAGLLVSACANKVAKVVSAKTGKVVADLPIGGRPDWAGYDARTQTVLIPTGEDGVVNVVDVAAGAKPAVVAKLPGHPGSRSGAIDPQRGDLYLPSADFVVAPGARPAPAPGSFKILVLGPAR
jgi:DNA-binding beta-propeller fold protein YncE